jgi:hypothetical protein
VIFFYLTIEWEYISYLVYRQLRKTFKIHQHGKPVLPRHICLCLSRDRNWISNVICSLGWREVIVRFPDIDGMFDNPCLNFLFKMSWGSCFIYIICGSLRIVLHSTKYVVFLLYLSSSWVPYVSSFSGLSIFAFVPLVSSNFYLNEELLCLSLMHVTIRFIIKENITFDCFSK